MNTSTRFTSRERWGGWLRIRRLRAGRARRSLTLCSLLLCCACTPAPGDSPVTIELEQLAFVPAGSAAPFVGVRCVASEDLLVDRFEVTRKRWDAWHQIHPDQVVDLSSWGPLEEGEYLPAVGMNFAEAQALAQVRHMRLPTVGEWMFIAGGSRAQSWPHGNTRRVSVANTAEVGLRRVAPAGTFPGGGSTGTGVQDLIGNVWEWVAPPLPRDVEPLAWRLQGRSPYPLWAMGGSFQVPAQVLFSYDGARRFNAMGLESGHRANDLGMRCVAGAAEYLNRHAEAWSQLALRERVIGVGRTWGRRAVPLLTGLVAEEGSPAALGWLLEGARQ